jgi:hypothetical protein
MVVFEQCLLRVADRYAQQVDAQGGRSLARVASIVVNHSAFFDRLRSGQTCFVRNLQRVAEYFANLDNWPGQEIPAEVLPDLVALGVGSIGRLTRPLAVPPLRKVG